MNCLFLFFILYFHVIFTLEKIYGSIDENRDPGT